MGKKYEVGGGKAAAQLMLPQLAESSLPTSQMATLGLPGQTLRLPGQTSSSCSPSWASKGLRNALRAGPWTQKGPKNALRAGPWAQKGPKMFRDLSPSLQTGP